MKFMESGYQILWKEEFILSIKWKILFIIQKLKIKFLFL